MFRAFIPFTLDIAPEPFGGGGSCADASTTAVIVAVVAIVLLFGVISLVRAVKTEKRAREMQRSAQAAAQLLEAVTTAQNGSVKAE